MKFLKEFKEFAMKASVVELAIAVVIGTAFGRVVSSLVADIIMPPIGWLIGGVKFTSLKVTLDSASSSVTINYGNFIQTIVDFLIVALAIFIVIKFLNSVNKKNKNEK